MELVFCVHRQANEYRSKTEAVQFRDLSVEGVSGVEISCEPHIFIYKQTALVF